MKKLKVLVRDKNTLVLLENASEGDIIDLEELMGVDTSAIEQAIASGQDKVYQNKLKDYQKLLEAEKDKIILDYENKLELLKTKKDSETKEKEESLKRKHEIEINELRRLLTEKEYEKSIQLEKTKQEASTQLLNLQHQLDETRSVMDSQIAKKELEVKNQYQEEIARLKNQQVLLEERNKTELEKLKIENELSKQKELSDVQAKFNEELKIKEEKIQSLQRQRSNLNVKMIGENLEHWCDSTVCEYMQNGMFNCTWTKDNEVVKNEGEAKGSKADYIMRIYESEKHTFELASICLDMKSEDPESKNKKKNEDYFKDLDKNRNKKGCKYAILVSELEMDQIDSLTIRKVNEYKDMYVVRPAYMMTLLNMIVSLTTKFSELILAKEQRELELKDKLALLEEFDKIKNTYLDKPLEGLKRQVIEILKQSGNITAAARKIEDSCLDIQNSYIRNIEDKIGRFELKLDKIAKKLPNED